MSSKRTLLSKWACLLAIGLASTQLSQAHAQTVIIKDGAAQASIVLPTTAKAEEKLAAKEIQSHLKSMSGAEIPIIVEGEQTVGVPIYIGSASPSPGLEKIQAKSKDPFALRVHVSPTSVDLTGNSAEGTLSAAYELLNQLGVQWYMPGPVGVEIPEAKTVILKEQDFIDSPAYRGRILQAIGDNEWAKRMRLGGFNAGAHGLGPKFDSKTEPELFYEENGKPTHQEKVSHPEVLKRVVDHWREVLKKNPNLEYVSIGPHDGAGFGSDPWDANDFDPIIGKTATTDRYIKFFNTVLEDLQKDYPNVGVAFYAYTQEMRPPVRETPNPKTLPMLAAIALDRFHSINNPLSWEKKYLKTVIDGWQAMGLNMMFRGYLFNLADHGMPFSMIDIVKEEWPYYHDKGFIAMRVECLPNWSYHAPALYLAARLYWDPKLDSDKIMDDYFTRFYGPAAKPMKEHFDIVENAFINSDYYTGNVFDIPKILTPAVRKEMARTLAEAEAAAKGNKKYEDRLNIMRLGFEYAEANFRMMDAYNRADFATAKAEYDNLMNNIVPACLATKPTVLSSRSHIGYLKRFWGRSVDNAAERITNGREVATVLPDEMRFFLDPYNSGEKLFLQDPQNGTTSWRPIKTWSDSTSNQGLRYYKGSIWYRTDIEVPAKYAGRQLRFWMGGVDDTPRVWIDGKEIPLMSRGAAPIGMPWEFDCTDAITPGKKQVVVIKVSDNYVNELGTVGLTGPIMIWAEPAGAPKWTPPDPNAKPAPKPAAAKPAAKKPAADAKPAPAKQPEVVDKNHM